MNLTRVAEIAAALTTVVALLGLGWRVLHLGELLRGTREFLLDWQGSPGRPGRARIPSVPERLARVEDAGETLTGQLSGVAAAVDRLARAVEANAVRVDETSRQVATLDRRVSRLEVEVERRLDATLLRAETYRATLVELGLDVEPPPPELTPRL